MAKTSQEIQQIDARNIPLLQWKDGDIIISPFAMTIECFKTIWKNDKTRDKENAKRHLGYIFFMSGASTLFQRYSEKQLEAKVKNEVGLPDKWKPNQNVLDGIEIYRDMTSTITSALLVAAEENLRDLYVICQQIKAKYQMLSNEKGHSTEQLEQIIKLSTSYITMTEKIPNSIENLEKLKDKVESEKNSKKIRFRGDYKPGAYEIPESDEDNFIE